MTRGHIPGTQIESKVHALTVGVTALSDDEVNSNPILFPYSLVVLSLNQCVVPCGSTCQYLTTIPIRPKSRSPVLVDRCVELWSSGVVVGICVCRFRIWQVVVVALSTVVFV